MDNKKKLRRILYISTAVFLVLIFLSRTIYNYNLPYVRVANIEGGNLKYNLEGYGELSHKNTYKLYAPVSGKVIEVNVKNGELIDEGINILRIDTSHITEELKELEYTQHKFDNTLSSLYSTRDEYEAEIEKLRSKNIEEEEPDKSLLYELEDIEGSIVKKEGELEAMQRLYTAGGISGEEYDSVKKEIEALKLKRERVLKDIEDDKRAKRMEFEDSILKREELIQQYNKEIKDTEDSIKGVMLDKKQADESSDRIRKSINGVMEADRQGKLINFEKQVNSYVTAGEKIGDIAILDSVYEVELICSGEAMKWLETGLKAEVKYAGIKEVGEIVSIKPEQGNTQIKVTIAVESENFTGGEYVSVNISHIQGPYKYLIPNEAVYSDQNSTYVYGLISKDSFFGEKYFAVKVRIFIEGKDEIHSAVSENITFNPIPIILDGSGLGDGNTQVIPFPA